VVFSIVAEARIGSVRIWVGCVGVGVARGGLVMMVWGGSGAVKDLCEAGRVVRGITSFFVSVVIFWMFVTDKMGCSGCR
jgi:hypothetical protein